MRLLRQQTIKLYVSEKTSLVANETRNPLWVISIKGIKSCLGSPAGV